MKKSLQFAVQFASFCKNGNYNPILVGEFLELIDKAFRAGEKDCNKGTDTADKPRRLVEEMAQHEWTLKTEWPGLYPTFTGPDGREVRFPCES